MQKKKSVLLIFGLLMLTSLACGNFLESLGDSIEETIREAISEAFEEVGLPVPEAVDTIQVNDGAVTFTTSGTVDSMVLFFRNAANTEGFEERTDLTQITDNNAYLVFEGHDSGLAVVIEIEELANNTVAVSMSLTML